VVAHRPAREERLEALLAGRSMRYDDAGRALGVDPNSLRYAALTGRFAIRWEGARRPTIWSVPAPEITPAEATLELARRFLHVFGPSRRAAFAKWAGVSAPQAAQAFSSLQGELVPVATPIGDALLLARDERALRAAPAPAAAVRLLPSGDAYTLHGTEEERALLVPDAAQRAELWTPRVWPGALLVGGEIVGTWRRSRRTFTVDAWGRLTGDERDAVQGEAESLPLPDGGATVVHWN
ncbi:MAG TPA: crosslink repair DNA glycosylase YcaQ family protein, partial [Gaiellaceae bacterium]|nr:crosslink repair DNA glycosylase YcaQ family protein [Gaiellaceae bacterium]